jgi:hypothetical protein
MLFDKYSIGEYHMIKTILTFTQTTPDLPQVTLNNILNQCAAWQTEGKYTGEVDATHDLVTGARVVNRWEWVDNATAQAYDDLVISSWIDIYPDVNVDIVVE